MIPGFARANREVLLLAGIVLGSLALLMALIPNHCGVPSPDWLFGLAVLTFSFGVIALTWRVGSLMLDSSEIALSIALTGYFAIGFAGWALATAVSPSDEFLGQGLTWVPFWIIGLFGCFGLLEQCT
jgi:hypothetical protein